MDGRHLACKRYIPWHHRHDHPLLAACLIAPATIDFATIAPATIASATIAFLTWLT